MPIPHSRRTASRVALLISSGVLFALAAWVAFQLFQPVEVPSFMSSKTPVSFNADKTIETNPLFQKLQIFVKGEYVVGTVGNPYPLGGDPKKKPPKGYDNKSLLATSQELQLDNLLVKDISRSSDGGVVTLMYRGTDSGQIHYEIREMGTGETKTLAQWDALPRPDLRAVGITQDATGKTWLLNEQGKAGQLSSDGRVSWLDSLQTGLVAQNPQGLQIASDSLDRIWMTDGSVVSMGGERGFSPVNLSAELTEDQRAQYLNLLTSAASQLGLQAASGPEALLRSALVPKRFFPLSDGRMGLTTAFGAFLFPQSQTSKSEWIPTLQFSVLPYAISDTGDVWGVRYTDHVLSFIKSSQEHAFTSGSAPSTEVIKPEAFSFSEGVAFVLEQSAKSTNLWSSTGDTWGVKLISTSGTQSVVAPPQKIQVDDNGVVWSLMSDGHLYRITAGAEVESQKAEL